MLKLVKRFSWYIVGAIVLAAIVFAFIPKPVEVDVAQVDRGPMRVTVDQDGKTRVKERYVISAPLVGRLIRVNLKAGDAVEAGKTVVASIVPTPPELLDARAHDEAEARVRAAEASLLQAEPMIVRATARRDQAIVDLDRAKQMAVNSVASQDELDQKSLAVSVNEAELKAAVFARDVAKFQLEQARAALARTAVGTNGGTTMPSTATEDSVFQIVSPITGYVLRVWQESEATVNAGTQLLEVGDIGELEAVIDVLSRDAVNVRPGAPVLLERWGGGEPLRGRVRRVEPSGFTKISALGVEEQRVNVIVDFADDSASRQTLGDGYRVDARIVTWERPDVLKVPVGALFRSGQDWSCYSITSGRAVEHKLQLGRMNADEAEVLDGLTDHDVVIMHPSDKIKDGVAVVERKR
jgi:HlyD family secretion protein